MCHKNGHIADSHRDLVLSKLMIHKSGYIWNLRDTATEAAQSAHKVEDMFGSIHTAVM